MNNDIIYDNKNIIYKREYNYQNNIQFDKLRAQELNSNIETKKQKNTENNMNKIQQQQNQLQKKDNINYNIKLTGLKTNTNDKLTKKNENINKTTTNTIIKDKKESNNKLDENNKNLNSNKLENKNQNEDKNKNKETNEIINEKYIPLSNPIGENACYINVSIQLLYSIIPFRNYIFSLKSNLNNFDELINNFYKIFEKYKLMTIENIFPIDTKIFRIILKKFSNNSFEIDYSADPIDFIIFLFNDIIIYNNDIIHKIFYIDIREQYNCIKCKNEKIIKYDKDNFFHVIYIEEILNFCEINKCDFENFYNKLFLINKEISHQIFMSCEKCKKNNINNIMEKRTICKQLPSNFLINCIWSNKNPDLEQIVKIYFMIQNDFHIKNLYDTNDINKNYIFKGMILYSYYLYHYIICLYDYFKKLFILINDETILSFKNMQELINYLITPENNFCFYPVIIMYIENDKKYNINFNLNKNFYNNLMEKVKNYKQKIEILNNKNSIQNKKENNKEISKIDENNNNLGNKNILAGKIYNNYFIKKDENIEKKIDNNILKLKKDNFRTTNNNKTSNNSSNKINLSNNLYFNRYTNSNNNNENILEKTKNILKKY